MANESNQLLVIKAGHLIDGKSKSVKKDIKAGKQNFVSILGKDRASEQADLLAEQAIKHLDVFKSNADILRAVSYTHLTLPTNREV